MGDQKDHMTIQKKESENASADVEVQDFEMATASQEPPALQLKASSESTEGEEAMEGANEMEGAYQFATDTPIDPDENNSSKIFSADTIQGKGIAEPFKMPIVQKKDSTSPSNHNSDKPSFTL